MHIFLQFILTLVFILIVQNSVSAISSGLKIPKTLKIGTSTSAYQVEGAWNVDGKSENIVDYSIHNYPQTIANNATADVAADFYHKYREDIRLLDYIGVDTFRFSISWARILPTGYDDYINRRGIDHYHRVLDELEKRKITPVVTIYHWDHPQVLEEYGGWLNEKMAYVYADYARVIFREFGHRIKHFSTVNEPYVICLKLYNLKDFVPNPYHLNRNFTGWGMYQCIHNILKAHALAYNIYNNEFRDVYNGKVGISASCDNYYGDNNETDTASSDVAFEFHCGCVFNPIFSKDGDYPEVYKQRIAERSRLQGYKTSRLPVFSKIWIELLKNSADFLGLNSYTSYIANQLPESQILSWPNDEGLKMSSNPDWKSPGNNWVKVVPEGLRHVLKKLKNKYNNPPVYITENGLNADLGIEDDDRINYIYMYMKELFTAINQDSCNVQIYHTWSFLDSFEWDAGYTFKYGLVHVDFNDKYRKRTLKKSGKWLRTVLTSRTLYPLNPNATL